MPDFSSLNPLAEIGIGKIGLVVGIFVGAIVFLGIIGAFLIW